MRSRLLLCLALLGFATNGFSKDVYLAIAGTVNNFHTDARIFNPSTTKDITVQAYFLPTGSSTNASVQPVSITIPKRSQKTYDDVVTAIFNASGLGAIRLSSDDDFVATSRIYAITGPGTLGQFVQGMDSTTTIKNGVLIQAKSTGSAYRTNLGAMNPTSTTANITWRLYDKNNAPIGAAKNDTLPPYGSFGPTNITTYFGTGTTDLSDAWIGFTSDQGLFAYISVLDSGTTDPTYIPASADSGAGAASGNAKVFTVTTKDFAITISPLPTGLSVGDLVRFDIVGQNREHGFELIGPDGSVLIDDTHVQPNQAAISKTFSITQMGTYLYTCTIATCGTGSPGHADMVGTFAVGQGDGPGRPGY